MAEAAAQAKRPLVISHTGARALTDHPRNTADATIKAVADKGGVVGVYFMPFLTLDSHPKGADLIAPCRACRQCRRRGPCRHRHRQWRAAAGRSTEATQEGDATSGRKRRIKPGIAAPGEAVGVYTVVADYNSVDRYRRFAGDLAKRGWSQARLEKLIGGNFLRVYREAWGG